MTTRATPVQQPYIRGSLAEKIQSERDAATLAEYQRHKRVTLALATLVDGIRKQLGEAMRKMSYDRSSALLGCEDVEKELAGVAEALREQIISPADNDARKAREAAEGAHR